MPVPEFDVMSVAEAAKELGITGRGLLHRIKAGTIQATKLGPGLRSAWVISRAEIDRIKRLDQSA